MEADEPSNERKSPLVYLLAGCGCLMLLLGLISVATIAGLTALGQRLNETFEDVSHGLDEPPP